MSAADDYALAQSATLAARDALGALNTLIDTGDRGVTGADLQAAQAELDVAERLEAVYRARAQEERAAADAEARERALTALIAQYGRTSGELSDSIDRALTALTELLGAATTHHATTRSALVAVGLNPTNDAVPGYGRLLTPSPIEVIQGVLELATQSFGMRSDVMHPHLALEPIAAFLREEVSA